MEYAAKAVHNAETVLGMVCSDGVILASEKIRSSRLQAKNSDKRIFSVDSHVGVAICGRVPDGMVIVSRARHECEGYRKSFGVPISG